MILRNSLSNEMKMNINMFGATVERGILGESDRALIVAKESGRYGERKNRRKFSKKFMNPNDIF